ncbi:MAG: AAA family ATPase [Gluconobacter japonicus]|uniref:AAA family ATPase n=2 Tax=Gluconobacter japonicus TaxID=376620 RepID=UPI001F2563E2|nr:AAA family ATPase [Gluconobacter japonicus]
MMAPFMDHCMKAQVPDAAMEVPSASCRTRIIAVASGKGGVGKTWLSISLAQVLASSGYKVLILDGDFGLANVDIQLGLVPTHDVVDILSGDVTIKDGVQHFCGGIGKTAYSFDVLAGRSGVSAVSGMNRDALDKLLLSLRLARQYDFILVDLCAGIDPITRHLAAIADQLLAVTTDEPTALADVYAIMKLYLRDRRRVGGDDMHCQLVINQASSHRSGVQTYEKLLQACRFFLKWEPQLAGTVRKDSRVSAAIRMQSSLLENFPTSPAAVDVGRLVRQVVQGSLPAVA